MRKGQSAMEYLMTYGWAILIIVVVGAVLFAYGVFSPAGLVPKSGCTSGNLFIEAADWTYSTNGQFQFAAQNRVGQAIAVTNVSVTDGTSTQRVDLNAPAGLQVASGSKSSAITVTSLPGGNTGDGKTVTLKVNYTTGSVVTAVRAYTCSLTGKIGE